MEERYQIRGKIGQGGLGAVYQGYDARMSRDIAIKRISKSGSDMELEEESTRQLLKEAGALASLQHPNIVTVYDVGADDEGPYVVMELITGKTIDELIERAPLTWADFREFAMQSQEALIAAHELSLIHSDIKPSNLMLSWLPSGKFQVKILDFGLATLIQSQSKQELEAVDAVYGSIHFMPPEQFERTPLDFRSDLYSMGCVYYHALTGTHPFEGKGGQEVMAAHLNHVVTPVQELRSDIPLWVCDWVMWQINRQPSDRPESARQSLSVFLQNDKNPDPTMSLGTAQPANIPKRPRLIIPGSALPSVAGPPPLRIEPAVVSAPPTKALLATPPATGTMMTAKPSTDSTDSSSYNKTTTVPLPLAPPEGSKPSVHTSPLEIPQIAPILPTQISLKAASSVQQATRQTQAAPLPVPLPAPKSKSLSASSKTTIAATLGILVIFLTWYIIDLRSRNADTKLYNEIIQLAAKDDVTEVQVNSRKLDLLLDAVINVSQNDTRPTIYKALYLAKATDSTDVDAKITAFSTQGEMLTDVRVTLINQVLRRRANPAIVAPLIAYAKSTDSVEGAVAAIEAVRFMANEDTIDFFVEIIRSRREDKLRSAAEETLKAIIRKNNRRPDLCKHFAPVYQSSQDDNIRHVMLRLLGNCGGPVAMETVKNALNGTADKDKIAAATALGQWPDDSAFNVLADSLKTTTDAKLRDKTLDSMLNLVHDGALRPQPAQRQEQWNQLATLAKGRNEQQKVVRELVRNFSDDWALKLLENFTKSEDEHVAELAFKGIDFLKEIIANKGKEK